MKIKCAKCGGELDTGFRCISCCHSSMDLAAEKSGQTIQSFHLEVTPKLSAFLDHNCSVSKDKGGAIGGSLTYCFTPTTLGVVAEVKCACGKKIDLTDYSW